MLHPSLEHDVSKWALGGVAVLIVCGLAGGVAAGVWFAAGWTKRPAINTQRPNRPSAAPRSDPEAGKVVVLRDARVTHIGFDPESDLGFGTEPGNTRRGFELSWKDWAVTAIFEKVEHTRGAEYGDTITVRGEVVHFSHNILLIENCRVTSR